GDVFADPALRAVLSSRYRGLNGQSFLANYGHRAKKIREREQVGGALGAAADLVASLPTGEGDRAARVAAVVAFSRSVLADPDAPTITDAQSLEALFSHVMSGFDLPDGADPEFKWDVLEGQKQALYLNWFEANRG